MKTIRHKHNKKRNTAFLYETLIKELTKSVVKKDEKKKQAIVFIIKEHFKKGSNLRRELELYKSLYETKGIDLYTAERILEKTKKEYEDKINKKQLFLEQTHLIKTIGKRLSDKVFSNFVPNYRFLATVSQIFKDIPVVDKVLLESTIIKKMSTMEVLEEQKKMVPISSLAFKTFIQKFNKTYSGILSENQKELIQKYIFSYSDDGLEFKIYLNEELGRLREEVENILKSEEVKEDKLMKVKVQQILKLMESFKNSDIGYELLIKVIKIQNLIKENKKNAN